MPTGTVKWFDPAKGHGFIAPDEGGHDVFVDLEHVRESGLDGLEKNRKVRYELQTGPDGRMAAGALEVI